MVHCTILTLLTYRHTLMSAACLVCSV